MDSKTDSRPQPRIPERSVPNPWIIIALLSAAGPLGLLALSVWIAGMPVISAYLHTSYWHYPVVVALLCMALTGVGLWAAIANRRRAVTPTWCRVLSLLLILVSIIATVQLQRWQDHRRHGQSSIISARYAHSAGPWVQFITDAAGEADTACSLAIWYFDPASRGDVKLLYGTAPDQGAMNELFEVPGGDGRRHEFRLYGLRPTTTYHYRIPALDATARTFTTGPAPGEAFRFLALGDTGNTGDGGSAPSYYGEVQDAADRWYRAMSARPAFKLNLGDVVRTGTDLPAWRAFFAGERHAASMPVMLTPGNHEFLRDDGGNWSYFFNQPRYGSFDAGGAHFLVLNAFDGPGTSMDGPVVSTGKEQYEFARRDLAGAEGRRWIIVLLHIPLMSTGDYNMNALLSAQYRELFKRHRVDLVLSGHDHNFDSFHADRDTGWGGTIYVVCGTGGSSLDSYIMDRPVKQWKAWYHDRDAAEGLYLDDETTRRHHVYGELSWGFVDVTVSAGRLSLTYCRWLALPDFLKATGQAARGWRMVPLPALVRDRMPEPVVRLEKIRTFSP